jgi:hypothetical protein
LAHETDFLELYRRLGLNPGCELAELKQAYRRHVAALHPDRNQGRPADARDAARLQRLTAQYSAAMDFHRRHGRLPGAPQTASPGGATGARELSGDVREAPDPFSFRGGKQESLRHDDASFHSERRPRGRVAVLLIVVALGIFGWAAYEAGQANSSSGTEEDTSTPHSSESASPHESAAPADVLHIGMSAQSVRAVEGEPLAMHGDLWEYGPSWIRFDHDEVVDWHSSPLRPLHTEAQAAVNAGR